MAVSVVLNLSRELTLKDMRHFVNCAPASMSEDEVIQVLEGDSSATYLEISISGSAFSSMDHGPTEQAEAREDRPLR